MDDLPAGLQIREVQKNNNGMFVSPNHQFKKWQTVLESQSIVSAAISSTRKEFCNYCFMSRQLTRWQIYQVTKFTVQCQKSDWILHKEQCGVISAMVNDKSLDPLKHISAEVLINLRVHIMRNIDKVFDHRFKNMVDLLQFQTPERKDYFMGLAVTLMENLGLEKNQENLSGFMHQISTVSLNVFTIQDLLCERGAIGIALFHPQNYINHSCQPNCYQIFDGRFLKIVANQQITAGQQVTISYLPVLDDFRIRQQFCKNYYLFECFCEKCQVGRMFDWSIFYILCPKCNRQGLKRQNYRTVTVQQLQSDGIISADGHQTSGSQSQTEKRDQIVKNDPQQTNVSINKDTQRNTKQQQFQLQKQCSQHSHQIMCKMCNIQIQEQAIAQRIQTVKQLETEIQKPEIGYQDMKKVFFKLKKLVSYEDPAFEQKLHKLYLKCLQEAQGQPQLYQQAYILIGDLIKNMPIWYQLDLETEAIPYIYAWRYAQIGKLAYNLNKKVKAAKYTELSYEILIKNIKWNHAYQEIKQLRQRNDEMKIHLSFKKAQVLAKR